MADEGPLSALFGAEDASESEPELAPPPLDASAAAVAMHAAHIDSALAASAAAYFDRQARLVGIQTEHMHEQRQVLLSHLKLKRLSERLRIATQLFFATIGILIAGYMLLLLHDALLSRAVIVDAFDTPPALAAAGQSGRVVAGALLDQLTRMQAATQASRAKRDLANSWGDDIKVEVAETGLSFRDIDRLLKARLGHDLHIGGDLVQTPAGLLRLTVRGDGVLPRSFDGPPTDLDRLTIAAGEYVYGQTQPALFAVYLLRSGRNREAIAFAKSAVVTAPAQERPYLYNAWAGALDNSGGSLTESLALERAALALKPDYWTAYANAMEDADNNGDEEGAWRLGQEMGRAAGGRPGAAAEISYAAIDNLTGNYLAERAAAVSDAEQHGGVGSMTNTANPVIAGIDAELHDFDDAKLRLASADLTDPYTAAVNHYVRGRQAELAGDTATAVREVEAWAAAYADPAVSGGDTSYHCIVAPFEEAAHRPAIADAALQAGGHFIDCYRFRADILDGRSDWSAARRAYADAVAIAPDLPQAYYSWGLALLRHHDPVGAIAQLAAANQRGPHWADPLKAWGDALAAQGRWAAAVAKYDEALRYAPAWPELRAARNAAAARP